MCVGGNLWLDLCEAIIFICPLWRFTRRFKILVLYERLKKKSTGQLSSHHTWFLYLLISSLILPYSKPESIRHSDLCLLGNCSRMQAFLLPTSSSKISYCKSVNQNSMEHSMFGHNTDLYEDAFWKAWGKEWSGSPQASSSSFIGIQPTL